ncbi:MAG: hypothetical protein E7273_13580 [Pseudobutyrivibrio ruminis]|nr:hypothetical protein [Pseudobutyrivibrio ruminis]
MSRLKELRVYIDNELNQLTDDDKLVVDSPMDELLKDADVIDHCFKDSSKPVKDKEQQRYEALCKELGLR